MATINTENLAEALKLLEEAAQDEKDKLRNLIGNKYTHLKTAFVNAEHSAAESLSASNKREINGLIHAKEAGTEKVTEAGTVVNDHLHTESVASPAQRGTTAPGRTGAPPVSDS